MNIIKAGILTRNEGLNRFQACLQIGVLLLAASAGKAQLYDPPPATYCNVAFDGPPSYNALESSVTSSDPKGKQMAQFVLEAFAQANSKNALLDPVSQSTVVTALTQIQAMWVPNNLNFKSLYNDTGVSDNNTVEFINESLVQISYRFPHLLAQYGPVSQAGTIENLLGKVLAEAQSGSISHHFTVEYTNQWLFRLCNMILSGQGIIDGNGNTLLAPNADVVNRGRSDFLTWISTVRNNGVHEFMSPTYTGLDLEALGYINLYALDPGIAAMAQQGYKLIWIDLYANWYNQNQRIGGTHSRSYEFLTDEDRETDRFFFAVSNLITQPSPAWPILLNTRTDGYWRGQDFISYVLPPPSDVPNLYGPNIALNGTRSIMRSFLSDESNYDPDYMFGENYMANPAGTGGLSYPFSVGSTESFYNDLTFEGLTIMMPGLPNTPSVSFNMQGRKDYYLQMLAPSQKSDTLKPFVTGVQNGGEALFLAASHGAADSSSVEVASTIVIPNSAQVWIGMAPAPVSLTAGQNVVLEPGSSIFIQVSHPGQPDALVTGIRFLLSTDMYGNPVHLSLVNDGSQYNALRVTCVHSASAPSGGNAVLAVWTRTSYCSDTSTNFNIFRNAMVSAPVVNTYSPGSGAVTLSVQGLNTTMTVEANAATESTSSLSGGDLDSAFTIPLLYINGTEFVTGTLQEWTPENINDGAGDVVTERSADGFYTGQVQVTGSGSDIWGTVDGFEFYYQTLTGNGTIVGQLTSMPSGSGISSGAKAGLMMRNDLTSGSANAFVELMGTFGQRFSVRQLLNGVTTRSGTANAAAPYWFKLTRFGSIFTGYSSPDGKTWTQVGPPTTIAMSKQIYVGIAVTDQNVNSVITTGFESVGILQQ
jgi:hypothetical protein